MSKPYQTETYDIDDDTKEYIDLYAQFLGNYDNVIISNESNIETLTIGDTTGIFNQTNKSNLMDYSNGIITINKSGNFHLTFKAVTYIPLPVSYNSPIFYIKKNGTTIATYYIQTMTHPSFSGAVNDPTAITQEIMFLSPIFRANIGDKIKIDISINSSVRLILNHNVFLKEI